MWVAGSAQALTQPTHLPTHHWFSFKFFFSFFPEKERERRGDEMRVGCFGGSAEGVFFQNLPFFCCQDKKRKLHFFPFVAKDRRRKLHFFPFVALSRIFQALPAQTDRHCCHYI
jgi:hypothetical protein